MAALGACNRGGVDVGYRRGFGLGRDRMDAVPSGEPRGCDRTRCHACCTDCAQRGVIPGPHPDLRIVEGAAPGGAGRTCQYAGRRVHRRRRRSMPASLTRPSLRFAHRRSWLVVNGVTIETQVRAGQPVSQKTLGGDLRTIQISHADPGRRLPRHAAGTAGHTMGSHEAVSRHITMGVGCRKGCCGGRDRDPDSQGANARSVIPAKAGVHDGASRRRSHGFRLRGNDAHFRHRWLGLSR